MPVEPSKRISETPAVRREESAAFQQRKKPKQPQSDEQKKPEKSGKVDITI